MARRKRRKGLAAIFVIIILAAAVAGYICSERAGIALPDSIARLIPQFGDTEKTLSSPESVVKCYEKAINEKSAEYMIKIYPKAFRDAYDASAVLQTQLSSAMDLGIDGVNKASVKITGRRALSDTELSALKEYAKSLSQNERIKRLGIDADALCVFTEGYVLECDCGGDIQDITVVHEPDGWCISPKAAVGKE